MSSDVQVSTNQNNDETESKQQTTQPNTQEKPKVTESATKSAIDLYNYEMVHKDLEKGV